MGHTINFKAVWFLVDNMEFSHGLLSYLSLEFSLFCHVSFHFISFAASENQRYKFEKSRRNTMQCKKDDDPKLVV